MNVIQSARIPGAARIDEARMMNNVCSVLMIFCFGFSRSLSLPFWLVIKLAQFSSFGKYYYHHRFCATVCLMCACFTASHIYRHTRAHTPPHSYNSRDTRSFGNLLTIPQKPICTCRNVGRSTYQRRLPVVCVSVFAP